MKSTLLYQSNVGIQFNKVVSKGICTVKVQSKSGKHAYTLTQYVYPDVELSVSSPFLSWENLNCCNGWAHDASYLLTAVQEGKKLYAGSTIFLESPSDLTNAEAHLAEIRTALPDTCSAGKELVMNERFSRSIFADVVLFGIFLIWSRFLMTMGAWGLVSPPRIENGSFTSAMWIWRNLRPESQCAIFLAKPMQN